MLQVDWSSISTFEYYAKISDNIFSYSDNIDSSFQSSILIKGVVSKSGLGHPIAPASIEVRNNFDLDKEPSFEICSVRTGNRNFANWLVENSSQDLEISTEKLLLIDLTLSEADLKRKLRKSFKSLVNKQAGIEVVSTGNLDSTIELCRQLHVLVAGRQTRSSASWLAMSKSIEQGNGLLIVKKNLADIEGYCFFFYNKSAAVYASSVMIDRKGNHALMWRGLLELKKRGVENFVMDCFEPAKKAEEKVESIRHFKLGFGTVSKTTYLVQKSCM